MSDFRNMQNEALSYGLRADLDALKQRVSHLESEIHQINITLQELIQKIENLSEPQE